MLVSDLVTRLDQEVDALAGRVQGAAELSELVRRNGLPQKTPAAFVLPLGLAGGPADAAAGLFRQGYEELIGVVLVVGAAGDATGARSLPTVDALVAAVIDALAGWAPDGAIGALRLSRGALVSLNAGVVIYQLDFALQDQLRIAS